MRLFRLGCIVLMLTCVLHLVGHFAGMEPSNDSEKRMLELMTNYRLPIRVTMMDLLNGFSLFFALSLLGFGMLGFAFVSELGEVRRKRLMWIYTILTGSMVVIGLTYFFAAPTSCLAAAFVLITAGTLVETFRGNRLGSPS